LEQLIFIAPVLSTVLIIAFLIDSKVLLCDI